jgi:hypothetical protein
MVTQTDVLLQHTFSFGGQQLNIGLNVINVFDTDTVTRNFTTQFRDSFNVSDQAFFSGTFDPLAIAAATPASYRPDPRYTLSDQYLARRTMRLNVNLRF